MPNRMLVSETLISLRTEQLKKVLSETFGVLSEEEWQQILQHIEWVDIQGGNLLFEQGMPSDGMYLVLSGRLQAELNTSDGQIKKLSEIGRGETIGEMALLTGEPRMASIRALRDSVLTKLPQDFFDSILVSKPKVLHHIARNLIQRLQHANSGKKTAAHISALCLLPITAGFDLSQFSKQLHLASSAKKNTLTLKFQDFATAHPETLSLPTELLLDSMMHWMNEQEATVDLVLLETEPDQHWWNQCCIRQSDAVLLIADADIVAADQILNAAELLLQTERQRRELNCILALFHAEHAIAPKKHQAGKNA